jgi:predicted phosphoribosyltransferase
VYRCDAVWFVLAVPVAPSDTLAALREKTDDTICPGMPIGLGAIASCYRDFQMSDDEVTNLLDCALRPIERDQARWMT